MPSRKLCKCHTVTLTQFCAFIILCRSVKQILFSISFTTVIVEKGTKAQGQSNSSMFQWVDALAQNILYCSRMMCNVKRISLSRGQWDLLGTCVCLCVCTVSGVTEFRSSIIPDWHQIQRYSQWLCLQVPQTAGTEGLVTSGLWVIRISWGEFILQLLSPSAVLSRSQQSLKPL